MARASNRPTRTTAQAAHTRQAWAVVLSLVLAGCGRPMVRPPSQLDATPVDRVTAANLREYVANVEATATARIAAAKAEERVAVETTRIQAREDMQGSVRQVTGWMLAVMALAAVAALIGSWFPVGRAVGLDPKDAAVGGVGLGGVWTLRYLMLAYGPRVADWLGLALILSVVIGLAVFATPFIVRFWRSHRAAKGSSQ